MCSSPEFRCRVWSPEHKHTFTHSHYLLVSRGSIPPSRKIQLASMSGWSGLFGPWWSDGGRKEWRGWCDWGRKETKKKNVIERGKIFVHITHAHTHTLDCIHTRTNASTHACMLGTAAYKLLMLYPKYVPNMSQICPYIMLGTAAYKLNEM